jgi:hypothetical protein
MAKSSNIFQKFEKFERIGIISLQNIIDTDTERNKTEIVKPNRAIIEIWIRTQHASANKSQEKVSKL